MLYKLKPLLFTNKKSSFWITQISNASVPGSIIMQRLHSGKNFTQTNICDYCEHDRVPNFKATNFYTTNKVVGSFEEFVSIIKLMMALVMRSN